MNTQVNTLTHTHHTYIRNVGSNDRRFDATNILFLIRQQCHLFVYISIVSFLFSTKVVVLFLKMK